MNTDSFFNAEIEEYNESVVVREIEVADIITKSRLPESDVVINPYVGCPHSCKYCYACFMKRFSNHSEKWGKFVDAKIQKVPLNMKRLIGKRLLLSSVTDPYNAFESKFEITRNILKQLINVDVNVTIITKSDLVVRDIDILKQLRDVTVAFSIETFDDKMAKELTSAPSIARRIAALKILQDNGVKTAVFVAPIFPYLTDWKKIITLTKDFTDEYWFDSLNLRGEFKPTILNYIWKEHKDLYQDYFDIYKKDDNNYWIALEKEIAQYCQDIKYHNFFKEKLETKNKV